MSITGTHNLQVLRGLSTISCKKDSNKVDLWNEDDGSGRQRWQIQGVWITKS